MISVKNVAVAGGKAVRVSLPAKVAFDLKSLQGSLANLAEELGHARCFSGVNCLFSLERNYVVDENLTLKALHQVRSSADEVVRFSDPDPQPARRLGDPDPQPNHGISVVMSSKVAFNIDSVVGLAARIAGELGCPGCHSAFDIRYLHEAEFLANADGRVRGIASLG